MTNFDFYFKIKEEHHDEVYRLLQILEQDQITKEVEVEKEKAQKRLDELVRLSK